MFSSSHKTKRLVSKQLGASRFKVSLAAFVVVCVTVLVSLSFMGIGTRHLLVRNDVDIGYWTTATHGNQGQGLAQTTVGQMHTQEREVEKGKDVDERKATKDDDNDTNDHEAIEAKMENNEFGETYEKKGVESSTEGSSGSATVNEEQSAQGVKSTETEYAPRSQVEQNELVEPKESTFSSENQEEFGQNVKHEEASSHISGGFALRRTQLLAKAVDDHSGWKTIQPIKFYPFDYPRMTPIEYSQVIGPSRKLANEAHVDFHPLEKLHELALEADKMRAELPANKISNDKPAPPEVPPSFHVKRHDGFVWGSADFRSKLARWTEKQCAYEKENRVREVDEMMEIPERATSNAELIQRSFQLVNATYDEELEHDVFPEKGRLLEYPFCDLRKCPQEKYPFIYFIIPHRNRVINLLRLLTSVRNATLRCDEVPEWYHCLCMYVSDYDTSTKTPLASNLEYIWRDRIRLLSRAPATTPWIKAKTYNSALRYIPTPSRRSLVFHIDADLVATDSTYIDQGLSLTTVGQQVAFPIVMGTKRPIQSADGLFQSMLNGTLNSTENSWIRSGGVGMTWFYLYDDNIGFFGSAVNKTTWGGEDNLFFRQFFILFRKRHMLKPKRNLERSLWHIWHPQVMDWRRSRNGLVYDKKRK